MSHTPGPWNKSKGGVVASMGRERNTQVAEVWNEANAHLIAAAPELLEALELILEDMKNEKTPVHLTRVLIKLSLLNAAKLVVAKAKGQP